MLAREFDEDTGAPAGVERAERARYVPGRYIRVEDTRVDTRVIIDFDDAGELIDARVEGARHAGEAFTRARLVGVELVRCDLAGCDFAQAAFERVRFVDCRCIGADLGQATFRHTTFDDCRFDEANFRLTRLSEVRFESSVLARTDFGGAHLDDVSFRGCDLRGADVSSARCTNVDLRGARLDDLRGVGSLAGATIGVEQLFGLAPGLASAIGLRVQPDTPEDA
jgi:uncharacterized protein YjbI with pentapeptide repeats